MLTSKTVEIQPQMFKKVYTFYDDIVQGYKAEKTEKINNSTVEFNGWVFGIQFGEGPLVVLFFQVTQFHVCHG